MKKLILCLTTLLLVSCATGDRGPASNEEACNNEQFLNQQSYFTQYEKCKSF